jgi:hypothetical protein
VRIVLSFKVCLSEMNEMMCFAYWVPCSKISAFGKGSSMITNTFMIYYDFKDTLGKDISFEMTCLYGSMGLRR